MNKRWIWILAATACLVGSVTLARPQSNLPHPAHAKKGVMHLSYHRTGGIAGFNDLVEVEGDSVTVSRRNKVTLQRKLTADEQRELTALAAEAKQTHFEEPPPHRPVPDAFNTSVSVDGQTVRVDAPPQKMPAAWQKLAETLAKFLTQH